jgi:hypothetical protein
MSMRDFQNVVQLIVDVVHLDRHEFQALDFPGVRGEAAQPLGEIRAQLRQMVVLDENAVVEAEAVVVAAAAADRVLF